MIGKNLYHAVIFKNMKCTWLVVNVRRVIYILRWNKTIVCRFLLIRIWSKNSLKVVRYEMLVWKGRSERLFLPSDRNSLRMAQGPNVTEDESGKGNADSGRRACFSWSFTYFNICEEILTMQKKPELITSSQTISRSILDPLLYSGLPTTPTLLLKPPAGYVSQQRISRVSY